MFTVKHCIGRIGLTLTATALVFHFSVAQAVPFSTGLSITGSTTFDDSFSFGSSGGFSVVESGATTASTYDTVPIVTGDNPLTGLLTDFGDGFGFTGSASVTDDGFAAGVDTTIQLINTSSSNIYKVFFRLSYSNSVNADGDDAFADSELILGSNGGFDDVFFSDLKSDTFFGDEDAGLLTGGFGDPLLDNGDFLFSFILNPSDILDLDMSWTLEGGDFASGLAESDFSVFLSIDSVDVKTPLPGTLFLVGIGIILLPLQRRLRGYMQR